MKYENFLASCSLHLNSHSSAKNIMVIMANMQHNLLVMNKWKNISGNYLQDQSHYKSHTGSWKNVLVQQGWAKPSPSQGNSGSA